MAFRAISATISRAKAFSTAFFPLGPHTNGLWLCRDQNVGIGVCAYYTPDSNPKPGLFTHFPDSAIRQ